MTTPAPGHARTSGRLARLQALRQTLAGRLLVASVVLAALVGTAFFVLVIAVFTLREATEREARSKDVTAATLALEKLVVDLETGLRGLTITGDARFLQPWRQAYARLPSQLERFERLEFANDDQRRRARTLVVLVRSYRNDYSYPLVQLARENREAAQLPIATAEGKQRTDAIRNQVRRFLAAENELAMASSDAAERGARRALTLAGIGLAASVALILLFGVHLVRSIGRPLRAAADGASRIASGDLSARLRERSPGEVGELERAFNTMAARLEEGRRELEAQNEQLRRSERQKSELVSIVSHEVRTPLASVLGFASFLLRHEVDAERRRHYLGIIEAQGRRLASLLDDFLSVQRIEEGNLRLEQEVVDMASLLREQVQLFTAQSPVHRLELELAREPLAVRGDSNRLAQVVANLLSNAIKYSPSGGTVEVVGEEENGAVRVSVRDEGLGIPAEDREQVFTKFFRGDASAHGISGSGLGLAFARAVIEAHGGHIDFESTAGEGSTFWVELPRAA